MKFIVGRTNLNNVLKTVGKSIGGGMVIATSSYRFKMEEQQLTITGCNLETSIEQNIIVESIDKEDFDVLIPAELLMKYIGALSDRPLVFSFELVETIIPGPDKKIEQSYNISIAYGSDYNGCRFVGYPGSDFPTITLKAEKSFEMDWSDLHAGIFSTEYAMPTKEEDNKLSVIHMEMGESGTSFTGFDGAYLATYNVPAKLDTDNILIPAGIAAIISGLSLRGVAKISYNDKKIAIQMGDITIKSLLKDGAFIDWRQNVSIWDDYVTFDREAFMSASKQALIFANKINQQLSINVSGTKITIKGEDKDFNYKSEQVIPCSECKKDITIGVNGTYLTRLLTKLDGNEVFMHFINPMRFLIFKTEDKTDNISLLAPQELNI